MRSVDDLFPLELGVNLTGGLLESRYRGGRSSRKSVGRRYRRTSSASHPF